MTKSIRQKKNSSKTFSQSLQSLAPDYTVCEVTHSSEKLSTRVKTFKPGVKEKKFKTLRIKVSPTENEEALLLKECAQFKWYYNAYLDTFDFEAHMAYVKKCKDRGDSSAPALDWRFIRSTIEGFDIIEEDLGNVIIQELVKNKNFEAFHEKHEQRQELMDIRKQENELKRKSETERRNKLMENMTKAQKKEFKQKLAEQREEKAEQLKEEKKQRNIENGKKPKTARHYPKPEWMVNCYGSKVGGETHNRIIRGACFNFVQNLNSATSNLYNGNIESFEMKCRTAKDKHEFMTFTDQSYPSHLRKLTGYYYYRRPGDEEDLNYGSRRTRRSLKELLKQHKQPITVIQDKQTKEWFVCLPVPREWFPSDDCRLENQENETTNGKAIGLDPGKRKFLSGYSTSGEALMFGEKACDRLVTILFEINKLESKLSEIRKGTLSDTHKEEYLEAKSIRWTKIKNLVREMHWKSAVYLVRNYQYIFLEDFSTKGLTCKPLVKRILNQYSFYQFKLKLAYLCEKYGCQLILVHPALTTKTCSSCGVINDPGLSETYTCSSCELSYDRDIHSSKNILIKGMSKILE